MAAVIRISDLLARCVLGVGEEERHEKQDVIVNIELIADLSAASVSDDFARTVDYRGLKKEVFSFVEQSHYYLLETLADRVTDLCLRHPLVQQASVRIDKPSALRFARSVSVEITRRREPAPVAAAGRAKPHDEDEAQPPTAGDLADVADHLRSVHALSEQGEEQHG